MLAVVGQCPIAASRQSLAYEGEKYASAEMNAAYVAAQEAYRGNITAAMCSNNYVGVVSVYQALLILTAKVAHHKSPENDGLVEFQSCAKGLDSSLFGTSYTDQFYMPELNHADTAFMTSDVYTCTSSKSPPDDVFYPQAFSSDMIIDVEYLDKPVSVSKPQFSDKSVSCSTVETATSVTSTTLALLTGGIIPASTSRNLKIAEHMTMEASMCECKSTPRPCIFFHGIGNKKEKAELQDKPCARMGSIDDHAPCCSTVKYAWLNTMDYGWNSDYLQQKFCDHALSMSDSSDQDSTTIGDTIIVVDFIP
ncbi:hypothetical protein JM18_009533 [Phytophthora kernoviae]|uniref:Uncharacterized protein n=1 Tax=Phytophthora kernoviae TaxID=325452 RepID=A0A921V4Y7_9STRA|nr:hypothetical protein JM18_009533 [Phytophthora kernoviae]